MKTRRAFLQSSSAAAIAMGLLSRTNLSLADPDPAPSSQASASTAEPSIYEFSIGTLAAYVIQDGVLSLPSIQPSFVPEASPSELDRLMKQAFLPSNKLAISMNVLVVKTASDTILIDTGAGSAFGPAGGRLIKGLNKIGITPSAVSKIIITHAHGDHIGGLGGESGNLAFPNADIFIASTELDFWQQASPDVSKLRLPEEGKAQVVGTAKKFLGIASSKLKSVNYSKLTPEIELLASPGHTPGHSCVLISSGADKLLHIGDAVHVFPVQFIHPEWTMAYDANPTQAIATRRQIFKSASIDKTRICAYHMPFPGIGHIRAAASAYEWVPQPWNI